MPPCHHVTSPPLTPPLTPPLSPPLTPLLTPPTIRTTTDPANHPNRRTELALAEMNQIHVAEAQEKYGYLVNKEEENLRIETAEGAAKLAKLESDVALLEKLHTAAASREKVVIRKILVKVFRTFEIKIKFYKIESN